MSRIEWDKATPAEGTATAGAAEKGKKTPREPSGKMQLILYRRDFGWFNDSSRRWSVLVEDISYLRSKSLGEGDCEKRSYGVAVGARVVSSTATGEGTLTLLVTDPRKKDEAGKPIGDIDGETKIEIEGADIRQADKAGGPVEFKEGRLLVKRAVAANVGLANLSVGYDVVLRVISKSGKTETHLRVERAESAEGKGGRGGQGK